MEIDNSNYGIGLVSKSLEMMNTTQISSGDSQAPRSRKSSSDLFEKIIFIAPGILVLIIHLNYRLQISLIQAKVETRLVVV